ncbi:hypothetical protein MBANPS3_001998 [Mucor bainieri]
MNNQQQQQRPQLVIVDMCARREQDVGLFFASPNDRFWTLLQQAALFNVPRPLNPETTPNDLAALGVVFRHFYEDTAYHRIRDIPEPERRIAAAQLWRYYVRDVRPMCVLLVGSHIAQDHTAVGSDHRMGTVPVYVVNNTIQYQLSGTTAKKAHTFHI